MKKTAATSGRRPSVPLDLTGFLERRAGDVSKWLTQNAPYCSQEQAHLNAGSREQAYWHHGYAMALRDVRALLRRRR